MDMWAATNIVGPDGTTILAGQPVPDDWPPELRQALLDTGGATDVEPAEED